MLRGLRKSGTVPSDSTPAGPKRGLPEFVGPQLATLVKEVPPGDDWLHEIKFDGYRMLARVGHGTARFISRNDQDWTERFGVLATAVAKLPVRQAMFDGEVVVLEPDGTTSFQALQNVLSEGHTGELVYFVFDLVHFDGRDLTGLPLVERKRILAQVMPKTNQGPVRLVEYIEGNGPALFQRAREMGLEGIVSKRRDAPYRSGRGDDWVKTKCLKRDEFVIVGHTDPGGARHGFGALLLGYHDDGKLVYAGKVGTGFSEKSLADLTAKLKSLEQSKSPLDKPASISTRNVHWVKPKLVAQIEFSQWTRDGMLRHPSFQGLREDKPASQVTRDRAKSPSKLAATPSRNGRSPNRQKRKGDTMAGPKPRGSFTDAEFAGVSITHPDRVLYPGSGLTKAAVAEYYAEVAEWMLPLVADRPLTLVRCPEGQAKPCFYQKHVEHGLPESVRRVKIREKDKMGSYCVIDDAAGLLSLIQFGVLEIHVWQASIDDIERPDRLVFDSTRDRTSNGRKCRRGPMLRDSLKIVAWSALSKRPAARDCTSSADPPSRPVERDEAVLPRSRRSSRGRLARRFHGQHVESGAAGQDLYRLPAQRARRHWIAPYSTRAPERAGFGAAGVG